MNRRLLTTIVAMALVAALAGATDARALTSTADGGWYWQNPLPHGDPITAIDFVDADRGWVVSGWGEISNPWWWNARSGQVLHTTDGGRTWSVEYDGHSYFRSVMFTDESHGWAVGDVLLRTTDGGRTWNSLPCEQLAADVDFVDPHTGWMVGGGHYNQFDPWSHEFVSRTTDGGATWTRQWSAGDREDPFGLVAVDFVDETCGWAVGAGGRILHSTDGGASWELQGSATDSELRDVTFADRDRGWIVGEYGLIEVTVDGGQSWIVQPRLTNADLTAVEFVAPSRVIVSGAEGALIESTDGGLTWSKKDLGTGDTAVALDFVDAGHGWLATRVSGGLPRAAEWPGCDLLSTDDGGATWVGHWARATTSTLDTVDFVSRDTGWVAGGGELLKSSDCGLSWARQVSSGVADVDFVDADAGWLVDSDGAVSRSNDGGQTWTLALDGPTEAREVEFSDRLRGWAAGDHAMWHTEDGGGAWQKTDLWPPSPDWSGDVQARDIVSPQEWWVFTVEAEPSPTWGDGNVHCLYHTTDAGLTWTCHEASVDGRPLEDDFVARDLVFVDERLGYVTGGLDDTSESYTRTYTTTDGGLTWSMSWSRGAFLEALALVGHDGAWAVGDRGIITRTVDGGATWTLTDTGVDAQLRDVCFVDATHGWIVGADGTILHTATGGEPDTTSAVTTQSGADDAWHNEQVTVRFSATDPGEPYAFGVDFTEWSLDGGPWTQGCETTVLAPADHSGDGVHTLAYRSRDRGGNLEDARTCTVRIDTTEPRATLAAAQRADGGFTVTVDDALSPVCTLDVRIVKAGARSAAARGKRGAGSRQIAAYTVEVGCSGEPQQVALPSDLRSRPYLLVVTATDLAGNAQAEPATGALRIR